MSDPKDEPEEPIEEGWDPEDEVPMRP